MDISLPNITPLSQKQENKNPKSNQTEFISFVDALNNQTDSKLENKENLSQSQRKSNFIDKKNYSKSENTDEEFFVKKKLKNNEYELYSNDNPYLLALLPLVSNQYPPSEDILTKLNVDDKDNFKIPVAFELNNTVLNILNTNMQNKSLNDNQLFYNNILETPIINTTIEQFKEDNKINNNLTKEDSLFLNTPIIENHINKLFLNRINNTHLNENYSSINHNILFSKENNNKYENLFNQQNINVVNDMNVVSDMNVMSNINDIVSFKQQLNLSLKELKNKLNLSPNDKIIFYDNELNNIISETNILTNNFLPLFKQNNQINNITKIPEKIEKFELFDMDLDFNIINNELNNKDNFNNNKNENKVNEIISNLNKIDNNQNKIENNIDNFEQKDNNNTESNNEIFNYHKQEVNLPQEQIYDDKDNKLDNTIKSVTTKIEYVINHLSQYSGGGAKIEINDSSLGKINLDIRLSKENKVYIDIQTTNTDLQNKLNDKMDELKNSLDIQKINVAEIKIISEPNKSQNNPHNQNNNSQQNIELFMQNNNSNSFSENNQKYENDKSNNLYPNKFHKTKKNLWHEKQQPEITRIGNSIKMKV